MAAHLLIYSLPMEESREPDVMTKPAPAPDETPPPDAVAGPIIEVPISERMKAALLREHRTIT